MGREETASPLTACYVSYHVFCVLYSVSLVSRDPLCTLHCPIPPGQRVDACLGVHHDEEDLLTLNHWHMFFWVIAGVANLFQEMACSPMLSRR